MAAFVHPIVTFAAQQPKNPEQSPPVKSGRPQLSKHGNFLVDADGVRVVD